MVDEIRGVPSTMAIAGHPIHHLVIPFPIAFLIGALATDLVSLSAEAPDPFWARASMWLIGAGLVMGVLAALTGLVDFLTIPRARAHAAGWVHFLGNAAVMAVALVNLLLRPDDPAEGVPGSGVLLSALTLLLLLLTGWMGGELAYRHKIGVIERDR